MLLARLDYNFNENMKFFARLGYDNASQSARSRNQPLEFHNKINVRSAAFGLDWNRGRFVQSVALATRRWSTRSIPIWPLP